MLSSEVGAVRAARGLLSGREGRARDRPASEAGCEIDRQLQPAQAPLQERRTRRDESTLGLVGFTPTQVDLRQTGRREKRSF